MITIYKNLDYKLCSSIASDKNCVLFI